MVPNNLQIVAVDDLNVVLEIIFQSLVQEGYRVNCFENPVDAMKFIEANEVHVLFTDLSMPQMSGLDLIREIHHKSITIPDIFVISGTQSAETRCECLRNRAIPLEKPFASDLIIDLLEVVKKDTYRNGKNRIGLVDVSVFDPRVGELTEEKLVSELRRILAGLDLFLAEAQDVADQHREQFFKLREMREWYEAEIQRIGCNTLR